MPHTPVAPLPPAVSERPDARPAPSRLPAPDAFPDEYTPTAVLARFRPGANPLETGPRSRTVRMVVRRRCGGWRNPPTPAEIYEAMRADTPTERQINVMTVLLNDATFDEVLLAHLEGAFTWRQLARALHRHGCVPPQRAREIRRFARPRS